ncbi:MAG: TerC family protein [Alcaligenaceae bacterium]|nr:TerC family protein [Alcaligenaceae bacterium]
MIGMNTLLSLQLFDIHVWIGLVTLIILEIVLGIDNLVFIAILAGKLPKKQRDKAQYLGLSLALVMRVVMLTFISYLIKMTQPLFSVAGWSPSARDLILLVGGFFLLSKATVEMHSRIEHKQATSKSRVKAKFFAIVIQIVILDAVFSLDSVITAVGMVDELWVMISAVIIAVALMMLASKPLTQFVNTHPTVVVLCLAFLMMIGFSLIAEGFNIHVPKGYLYGAMGFSIFIEVMNQLVMRSFRMVQSSRPLRERTAEGILKMLGGRTDDDDDDDDDASDHAVQEQMAEVFEEEERHMVSGVLKLADRSILSIMTPRNQISWVNIEDDPDVIRREVMKVPHGFLPVCEGSLDKILGVGRSRDIVTDLLLNGEINLNKLRPTIIVPESIDTLRLIETLKASRGQLVLVSNEFGVIEGLVTPIDVFETIAGEFPDEDEVPDIIPLSDNTWLVDGLADMQQLTQALELYHLRDEENDTETLAGYLLGRFERIPVQGESLEYREGTRLVRFEIKQIERRRIAQVLVSMTMEEE